MNSLRSVAVAAASLALLGAGGLAATVVHGLIAGTWPDGARLVAAVLAVHVLCLGAVVARFSATNLRGQARVPRFAALLALALAALVAMAASPTLVGFAAGWTLSGLAIAGLVHHVGTPLSRDAARRVVASLAIGDVGLWLLALGGDALPEPVAVLALVAAVVSRGALVPLGEWLPETAEAPSPVSALLHAGVVNGGVLLLLLHGDVLPGAAAPALTVIGGLTVLAAVLAQQGRTDVKGRLAASTSAQMGLATVQAAIGLPATAFVHVIAHAWWKAWLFLGAGGAVTRARETPQVAALPTGRRIVVAVAALAAAVATGFALPHHLPVTVLAVPAVLVGAVAAASLQAGLAAQRSGAGWSRPLAALVAVVAFAGIVLASEHLLESTFEGALGEPDGLLGGLALVVLALAALAGSARIVDAAALDGLRARLALPGWSVRTRRSRLAERIADSSTSEDYRAEGGADRVRLAVRIASSTIAPNWPLRFAISVSPQDGLERFDVDTAEEMLDRFHRRDPRALLRRLLVLHADGVLSDVHLRRALADLDADHRLPTAWHGLPPEDVVTYARALVETAPAAASTVRGRTADLVQAAHWCAQAWGRTDARGIEADPWRHWLQAARRPGADLVLGVRGIRAAATALPEDPMLALALLHAEARRRAEAAGEGPLDLFAHLAGLLASLPGWAAHARWRVEHGGSPDAVVQLCALLAAHELLLTPEDAPHATRPAVLEEGAGEARRLLAVFQRALDLVVQERLLAAAPRPTTGVEDRSAVVHSLWCLDARSAPLRRHLESLPGPRRHRTHGVAGFFGIAVEAADPDGTRVARAPGLLDPDLTFRAAAVAPSAGWSATAAGRDPLAALGYAEVGGLIAAGTAFVEAARRVLRRPARPRPADWLPDIDTAQVCDTHGVPITPRAKAERVAAVLRAAGLDDELGAVLLVVGHGATTANNAYAASYDCGACGANPGVLNAAVFAAWFDDPAVRAELPKLGIVVPPRATAVPAWHDTTADVVVVESDHPDIVALQGDLEAAAARARAERSVDLPGSADPLLRGADGAEPMPEWGLAGAHGLLIGRSRIPEPGARWFQLDYRHEDDGVEPTLLRDALAGPGLVAAGIMACYAQSAAYPELFGAGDKTTHNVVGDIGVVRGRAGDLAIGLPWQALTPLDPADPAAVTALRHLPARPLIAVEAPRERVLDAVRGVPALHGLVANRWVTLWAVEADVVLEYSPARGWVDARTGELAAEVAFSDGSAR
ncbi:hypothetical protein GCM10022215_42250 [Nocardioides fonticola]|uniref:NADH:quinone oxidoreductase/Mrp antiporter transmembrane domain-containing protein n=1 Tax=Nocardioides fonticola TaxID=450363 RepID=A0ABP7Y291_9ACTN